MTGFALTIYAINANNPVPMSTIWLLISILAGREPAIKTILHHNEVKTSRKKIFDFYKVNPGLVISIVIFFLIKISNV